MSHITFPDIPVHSMNFRCERIIAESISPFSFNSQTYDWGAARWQGELTFETYAFGDRADDRAALKAFLMECNGKVNTFNYGDAEYLAFGGRGVLTGTPLVKGASQSGKTLLTDGWTPGTTNIVKGGDYIQLLTTSSAQLYMVTSNANSDGSGNATLQLNRPLLTTPADNAVITVASPKGVFKLADNNMGWQADPSGRSKIVIPIVEAL